MSKDRGRPRAFDLDTALDKALHVFWKHGFLKASMAELTLAMGVAKPSLYAAFGDKESLYLKTLHRYIAQRLSLPAQAMNTEADAQHAVKSFLTYLGNLFTDPQLPGGCFVINGAIDCGEKGIPAAVDEALRGVLGANEGLLRVRLERAQQEGQLSPLADVDTLATFFLAAVAGMSVLAKSGAKQAQMNAIVESSMAAWQVA